MYTMGSTVLEIGCGTVMIKLRTEAARIVNEHSAAYIRIHLHQADMDAHDDHFSLSLSAHDVVHS
jgi:hypothetical protein